ncbi:MAG TPA: anti-sigma factor antagonist [Lachnospiraceae bacterium]|nr:anti-sigma factor antagonist [Lachnospiraceae bacterium]
MLEIGMEIQDDVLNVSLKGKLDGMTFTEFEEQLESKRDEAQKIVIDATGLEYVSSAGLRVIMSTELYMEKNNKERIKITNASDDIKEIIELCGFDQVIDME